MLKRDKTATQIERNKGNHVKRDNPEKKMGIERAIESLTLIKRMVTENQIITDLAINRVLIKTEAAESNSLPMFPKK